MQNFEFRKLNAEDAVLLSHLALTAYSDHYLHLWHDGGKWYTEKCFSVKTISAELNDPNSIFFLASYNNSPVGFLKLNINAPCPSEEETNGLELERIYLLENATGIGIGQELLNLTFGIARQHDKDIVWLKAMDSSDRSISFYKKMGFEISGTLRLTFPVMKEEFRGMVIMEKRV